MPPTATQQAILSAWVDPQNPTIQAGYDFLTRQYQIPRKEAKRRVHAALEVEGFQPHHPGGIPKAWSYLRSQRRGLEELQ